MENAGVPEEFQTHQKAGRCEKVVSHTQPSTHAAKLVEIIDHLHFNTALETGISRTLKTCADTLDKSVAVLLQACPEGTVQTVRASDSQLQNTEWFLGKDALRFEQNVADLRRTPNLMRLPKAAIERNLHSLLSRPIAVSDDCPIVLAILSGNGVSFSNEDQAFFFRASSLLEKAILQRKLERRNSVLASALGHVENYANTELPMDRAFEALNSAYVNMAEWQRRIIELTNDLLCTDSGSVDSAINLALARAGELASSDRTYVFRRRPPDRLDNTHEWTAPGIDPMIAQLQDMPDDLLIEWEEDLISGRSVEIPDVNDLPENSQVKPVLQMQSIRSLLAVPIRRGGELTGFVGYDAVRIHRRFLPVEIQLLQAVANAIGVVLDRAEAQLMAQAANQRVQHERDRLSATFAAIPDLVLEVDKDGRFCGVDGGSRTRPAFPPHSFLGRTIDESLPPELAAVAHEMIAEMESQGACKEREYSLRTGEEECWYSVSIGCRNVYADERRYVFLVRDITSSHLQQRQIRRLGEIVHLTSNLVIVADAHGLIEWVNPAFEVRTGWTLPEIAGRRPGSFLQSDRTDMATVRRMRTAITDRKPVRAEVLNVTRDGGEYWVSMDIQPLFDREGALEGYVSVQTDITELQRAYRRRLRVLGMALDASRDGVAVSDTSGHYVYMNPTHRRMFGISEDIDITTLTWRDLTPPEQIERFLESGMDDLRRIGSWGGEVVGRRLDGGIIHQDVALSMTEDGRLLCITRDISERREIERQRARLLDELQRAQRREIVAHLASGVAHDLSNLIAVVSGTVPLLQRDIDLMEKPEAARSLDRISRAMDMARELVGGLGCTGRPDFPAEELLLGDVVNEAIDLLGSERIEKHQIRNVDVHKEQTVWANRTELLQVIGNLAVNACDSDEDLHAMVMFRIGKDASLVPQRAPDIGRVDLRRTYSVFQVADTGPGIDPSIRDRVFEMHISTKGPRGTGMGLPIVASIVSDRGGALWMDSAPGSGTCVTIAWPAKSNGSDVATLPAENEEGCCLSGYHVLVVDDDIEIADLHAAMLESAGAVAVAVSEPEEALSLVQECPEIWSVIVTDLQMPGMNGEDLAMAVAKFAPRLRCVLLTGHPTSRSKARQSFAAILNKPVVQADLLQAVRAAASG